MEIVNLRDSNLFEGIKFIVTYLQSPLCWIAFLDLVDADPHCALGLRLQ